MYSFLIRLLIALLCIIHALTFHFHASGLKSLHLSRRLFSNTDKIHLPKTLSISGEIDLPGSKSLSNRILLLSALSHGTTVISNILESEDTHVMVETLKQLNVLLTVDWPNKKITVIGNNGPFITKDKIELFLGNAGTAMRPMTAVLCAGQGEYKLDGIERMRERPIIDLIDSLQQLCCNITCSSNGCPPVHIKTDNGIPGGETTVSGKISSQYLSALLIAAPLAKGSVKINIKDTLVSTPYVHMTLNLMRRYGITIKNDNDNTFRCDPGQYISPQQINVEGDASSASYFLAAAAITGGEVTVHGVGEESIQGDSRFAKILQRMGADVHYSKNSITVSRSLDKELVGISEDCGDIPDVAMTLAIVAIFAKGKTVIRNVYNWRVKETERMTAIVSELTKLGVRFEEGDDYLVVHGLEDNQQLNSNVEIETYNDHRMAMCFSLVCCGSKGVDVTILNPSCTSKTFPSYFDKLQSLIQ